MTSPITGRPMHLVKENRCVAFRKEEFEIVFHYYLCEDSGEHFTNTAIDELNTNQVYNQYRDRYNIPFPEEISRIRAKYGLAAVKMSEVLGFGPNTYRLYEAGEMPSVSNAKLIHLADNPRNFMDMLNSSYALDQKTIGKLQPQVARMIEESDRNMFDNHLKDYLLGAPIANVYSGYRTPNFNKFAEMVIYFADKLAPFKTKLNKLLFYADFLMFKQTAFSISGVRYRAIERGPVPSNFNSIFEYMVNARMIDVNYIPFPQGYTGEQFTVRDNRPFDKSWFSSPELEIMERVAQKFKDTTAGDIVEIAHLEQAWKQNHELRKEISYNYAFELEPV